MYLIRWLDKPESTHGEVTVRNTTEAHDWLVAQGYSDIIVSSTLQFGLFIDAWDVVTMEELTDKPAFIVSDFGTLRVMKRPTKAVTKIFECRSEAQAYTILKKTARRISKYRYAYPVEFTLKQEPRYWYKDWIHKVQNLQDPSITLGDVRLLAEI